MNKNSKIKVNANSINQRLDNFLFRELKNIPKSLIYRLLRKGVIKVNNKKIKPEYKLLLNDEVSLPNLEGVDLDKKTDQKKADFINPALVKQIKSRIVYENNDFLILNKPAGLAVHGGSKIKVGIIDILRNMYGQKVYLELVHRLDRDTSGCLLIAKNRLALNDLSAMFREGTIKKTYLALIDGLWSNSKRIIDHPLRRSVLQGGERMVVVDPALGKPSVTRVEIRATNRNTSLLQLSPITGRTHQLRVHLAYEKRPIIGDDKYGNKELNKLVKSDTNLNRIFLHAFSLEFNWARGRNGDNSIAVSAPLDKDLEKTLHFYGYI
jgi:23S rRNA pseudouridine955/2504/2580 synthase